jgi:cold shock CspA family protein
MSYGIIKRVLEDRGCGFIASANGVNVYFQSPGLKSHALTKGQRVYFKVGLARKGFIARDVQPAHGH